MTDAEVRPVTECSVRSTSLSKPYRHDPAPWPDPGTDHPRGVVVRRLFDRIPLEVLALEFGSAVWMRENTGDEQVER